MSGAKALRLALSKAAQEVLSVPVTTGDIEEQEISRTNAAKLIPPKSMVVLLRRKASEQGLMVFDPALFAAVLEARTTGRVTPDARSERAPTSTDAVLCRRFQSVVLSGLGAQLAELPAGAWAGGYAPDELVENPRRLPHLLADVNYQMMDVSVEVGLPAVSGRMLLILPRIAAADPIGLLPPAVAEGGEAWTRALQRRVLDSPASIDAILHRIHLPLSQVARLEKGHVLIFSERNLDEISLETTDGDVLAVARLGRADGNRAVKLDGPVDASALVGEETEPMEAEVKKFPVPATTVDVAPAPVDAQPDQSEPETPE